MIQLVDVYEDEKYLHLVTELCLGGEVSSDTIQDLADGCRCDPYSSIYLLSILSDVLFSYLTVSSRSPRAPRATSPSG